MNEMRDEIAIAASGATATRPTGPGLALCVLSRRVGVDAMLASAPRPVALRHHALGESLRL